jgi:hypothetical protein
MTVQGPVEVPALEMLLPAITGQDGETPFRPNSIAES